MNKKDSLINNPELEALKTAEGIDPDKLMEAAGLKEPGDPKLPDTPPAPPAPPPAPLKEEKPQPPKSPDAPPQTDILKEIFGDRFKTVDEVKQANIVGQLEELQNLRQVKTDLESKLAVKPKTNFADDEVALYNEFVRETGIKNYSVFSKINTVDIANMDPMDALIAKTILATPSLAGKEEQIRKHFEKKYNVDPESVDESELAVNKIGLESDANSAKKELQTLKDKLKVPEPQPEPEKPKVPTPEEKAELQKGWTKVGDEASKMLAKLNVPIKGAKDPLLSYELSEDEIKDTRKAIIDYAVENHMELNENNVKVISSLVYNQLMLNKLPDIVHSVFEKARQMTEKDVHAMYENPSPQRNNDQPPTPPQQQITDKEKLAQDIYEAEMGGLR